ncbi:MAG: twin-arginine translocase subunit TatC [Dehalococcoidia bacterium]|nr:twin-arginine translocase subunit TatC [Dehalococcoidia bacterium]MDW8120457.1 twin-arginine translocase subunit TatC [Chloroflexota bacterium]
MMRDRSAPLRYHLQELRRRLLISVLAVAIATAISFAFYKQEVQLLLRPAQGYASITGQPVYTEVTELLGVVMKVSLLFGFVGALPVVLYQVLMFVAPGLTAQERRFVFTALPAALLLFAGGVAFAYFILLPPALRFLLTFANDIATPMIRIGAYVNMVVTLLFWVGLVFEMPLVVFILARLGVISPDALVRGWRLAVVGAFLLAAIITPTFDPVNQSLVAGPLVILYFLSIGLAYLARRQHRGTIRSVVRTQTP